MPLRLSRTGNLTTYALTVFRLVVGLLFACHGAASLFGIFGGAVGTKGGAVAIGVWPSWYAAVIQLVCGVLVMTGLFTRLAALIASGSMAYAYFVVHQSNGLLPLQNKGETAALFCWVFFLLVFTGPGAFALDTLLRRRGARIEATAATA
ncbi:DoxX family protein [Amycolatopsis viridis]|uniref:Oxidoreductase n=1 Tax=Amycolatopsis viridis TaxID=185678 RepID=A0ABX0SS17_9PSEU|nr:DoxX family protein [Amycolatopsis viridis]NIH79757.1 putative oxidoreductase [Amycolatopsis viridis]